MTRARKGREATGIDSLQVTYVGRTPEWGLRAAQAVLELRALRVPQYNGDNRLQDRTMETTEEDQEPPTPYQARLATPLAINIGRDQEVRRWPAFIRYRPTIWCLWVKPCGPAEQSANDSASRPAHSMGCDSRKVLSLGSMAECQRRTWSQR